MNIADALRFVPGVDVLRSDRNRVGVGVRGLNIWSSERTLTLIDGRDTDLPFVGAPDFASLPLFMEDIDRVEVVRGPGGAAWGANALNGVVNIITKDPDKTLGVLMSTRINQFGETSSQFRWGAADGNWSWRLSAGYQEHKSSEDTVDNDTFVSRDFNRQVIIDSKAVYKVSADDKLSFGIGYSGSDRGDTSVFHASDNGDERLDDARLFARFDHAFQSGGSMYLQWSGMFDDRNQPNFAHAISRSNNVDAQVNLPKLGAHSISFGGNIRNAQIDLPHDFPAEAYFPGGDSFHENWIGGFVQDRFDLADDLWLEGQLRIDYSSATNADWSGRIALLHALDTQQHHIVRVALARAFRTLGPQFREAATPGFLSQIPSPNIANEGAWAIEAGYNGRILDSLTLRIDGYFQKYSDLIGLKAPASTPLIVSALSEGGADTYGLETELALKGDAGQLSVWYAYHAYMSGQPDANIRAFAPPSHSAGISGRLLLPHELTLNANYRYTNLSEFPGSNGYVLSISPTHRLDLTLTKSFADGRGEFMIGIEDAFNTTVSAGQENFGGAARMPGRTVFARVQLKF
jgi:iron complex outermembrane receptor protein